MPLDLQLCSSSGVAVQLRSQNLSQGLGLGGLSLARDCIGDISETCSKGPRRAYEENDPIKRDKRNVGARMFTCVIGPLSYEGFQGHAQDESLCTLTNIHPHIARQDQALVHCTVGFLF